MNPRVFVSIDSAGGAGDQPSDYVAVKLRADFLPEGGICVGTGDFLVDWHTAFHLLGEHAEAQGIERVWLQYSSTVDWWEHDSCQFIEISERGEQGNLLDFVTFRRATSEEEAELRRELAEARA